MPQIPQPNNQKPAEFPVTISHEKKSGRQFSLSTSVLKIYSVEIVLFVFAFFILAVALFFFGRQLIVIRERLAMAQVEITSANNKLAALEKTSFLIPQFEEYSTLAEQAIPSDAQVPYFQNQLLQMASASGVNVTTLGFSGFTNQTEKESILKKVNISLSISGSAENILQFMETVESSRRIVLLENFRFSTITQTATKENPSPETSYALTLQLTGYYLPVDVNSSKNVTLPSSEYERIKTMLNERSYYDPKADATPPADTVPVTDEETTPPPPEDSGVQ